MITQPSSQPAGSWKLPDSTRIPSLVPVPSIGPTAPKDIPRNESIRTKPRTDMSSRSMVQEFWKPSITPEEDVQMSRRFSLRAQPNNTGGSTSSFKAPPVPSAFVGPLDALSGNTNNNGNAHRPIVPKRRSFTFSSQPNLSRIPNFAAGSSHSNLGPVSRQSMLTRPSSVASTVTSIKAPSILSVALTDPLEALLSESAGDGNVDRGSPNGYSPDQDASEDGSDDGMNNRSWQSRGYVEQRIQTIEAWLRQREGELVKMAEELAREAEGLRREKEVRKKKIEGQKREIPSESKQRDGGEAEGKEAELRRREEEVDRREMEAGLKEQEVERRELETRRMKEEVRRKEDEVRIMDEEARRRIKEAILRGEETRKKEEELRRLEEGLKRREEDLDRRVEDVRRWESNKLQEESGQGKEETLRHHQKTVERAALPGRSTNLRPASPIPPKPRSLSSTISPTKIHRSYSDESDREVIHERWMPNLNIAYSPPSGKIFNYPYATPRSVREHGKGATGYRGQHGEGAE